MGHDRVAQSADGTGDQREPHAQRGAAVRLDAAAVARDIGWFADEDVDLVPNGVDQCQGSDLRPTIFIDGTDTGVANPLFTSGCTITDLIDNIAATSANHGQFESRLVMLLNALEESGFITREDRLVLQAAGAKANLP